MRRPALFPLLTVLLLAAPSPALEPTPSPRAAESAAGRLRRVHWWNQPQIVEALGLSPEQRKRMDAVLRDAMDRAGRTRADMAASRGRFRAALRRGDWEEARRQGEATAVAMAKMTGIQTGLKADTLRVMTDEQRAAFFEKYPHLLQALWWRGGTRDRRWPRRPGAMRGSRVRATPMVPP